MIDPLDIMNETLRWPDPPEFDERWLKKVGALCERIAKAENELAAERKKAPSKRKQKSNDRAQLVARRVRWLISCNGQLDHETAQLVLDWMKYTGNVKYKVP